MAAKSSSLSHVSFLKMMRTKSTRALSFSSYSILDTSMLQGRMTSWDWSLRRQHWKLFKWSFRGWRWSRRRCTSRILIVEQTRRNIWIKMRKKKCYEIEMCDDQLRFFLFSIYFLVVQKVEFSHPVQYSTKSQISLFSWASCSRSTSFAWLSGRTLSLLQLECSREEECLVRARNFSAHNPQLFSFSPLLTEVPKNWSHPRLIQEYFSSLFFFFRWRA